MSVLTYRCPKTSRDVRTSIETDARALAKLKGLKLSVVCPHCVEGHIVPANEVCFGASRGFCLWPQRGTAMIPELCAKVGDGVKE